MDLQLLSIKLITVFAASSLALALAAVIRVLAGGFISQYISDQQLPIMPRAGFITINVWILPRG